ncbi:MAG: PEP-CTERM sorting domain-containing protein [Lentimonas sp.]
MARAHQLQFSTVAVPEPSSFAVLAGAFALGAVMIRRRRS